MNKIGQLLNDLLEAETDLAAEYRVVAERDAADHDVHYLCQTLARQCDDHARWIVGVAEAFDEQLTEERPSHALPNIMGSLRHKTSELLGRRPEAGLLLLRDLRQLYLMAQEVNVHWLALGQVAQAIRDQPLLSGTDQRHKETLTQIKWLKTRIKEAVPQVLTVSA